MQKLRLCFTSHLRVPPGLRLCDSFMKTGVCVGGGRWDDPHREEPVLRKSDKMQAPSWPQSTARGASPTPNAKGYFDCPRPPSLLALMLGKISRIILPKLAALSDWLQRLSQYRLQARQKNCAEAFSGLGWQTRGRPHRFQKPSGWALGSCRRPQNPRVIEPTVGVGWGWGSPEIICMEATPDARTALPR